MANEVNLTSQVNKCPSLKDDSKIKSFSNALLFHLFSFINESDLALFFSTSKLLSSLQKQYTINLIDKRCAAWKKILSSKPKTVNFNHEGIYYKLTKNHLFWSSMDFDDPSNPKRYCMDLTSLSITPNETEYYQLISDGDINERISVSFKSLYDDLNPVIIFDNERRCQLCKIVINHSILQIKSILGTKLKDQILEFVTKTGIVLQLDSQKLAAESDKKELEQGHLNIISCIPKEFQNSETFYIERVFKVKKLYYFQWATSGEVGVLKPIIAMKDINFPDQRKMLQPDSTGCVADDHFLYVYLKNEITIYKGEISWKKIILKETFDADLRLNPTSYGLVIRFYHQFTTQISFWEHRKYDPTPQVTPVFEKLFNRITRSFVQNDLLIYIEDKTWKFFHLIKKEVIGVLPIENIRDIITSNNPIPEHFIVQLGSYTIDPCCDFLIFSDKN